MQRQDNVGGIKPLPDKEVEFVYKHNDVKTKLGAGNYAAVWLGEMTLSEVKTMVAIKSQHNHTETLNITKNEIRMYQNITSKQFLNQDGRNHILNYFGYRYQDNNLYLDLIVEYVNGQTLEQWLNKQKSNIAKDTDENRDASYNIHLRETTIFLDVSKGLEFLHANKIIHHDLKPANIFIANINDGITAKIGDLGLSRHAGVESDDIPGTPVYMAPEILAKYYLSMASRKNKNTVSFIPNEKNDIYSLALVMAEVISRKEPFQDAHNLAELHRKVVVENERMTLPSGCAEEIKALIVNAWNWNPAKRSTASTIKEQLCKYRTVLAEQAGKRKFTAQKPSLPEIIIQDQSCSTNLPIVSPEVVAPVPSSSSNVADNLAKYGTFKTTTTSPGCYVERDGAPEQKITKIAK